MKSSHTFLIIANMYIAVSFLVEGFTNLILFFLGCFWFVGAIIFLFLERDIERLEGKMEHQKFEMITNLLCHIAGIKLKRKKKYKALKGGNKK